MTTQALAKVSELDRYMAQIRQYPILEPEQEAELSRRWKEHGDIDAAQQLVTSNLRFVVKIAHEYKGYGAKIMDLIQEGSIGLMQAVKRFDVDKGYRLVTYAVFWIRSYIHSYLMSSTRMIKIGTSRAHRKLFFKLRSLKGKLAAGGQTDKDTLTQAAAEEFGVTTADIIEMEQHLGSSDASLDTPNAETGTTMIELLPAKEQNQEELLHNLEEEADQAAKLETAVQTLDTREQEIIRRRYLSEDVIQLKDLGSQMGVSKQRVSQLEKRAIEKLRRLLLEAA